MRSEREKRVKREREGEETEFRVGEKRVRSERGRESGQKGERKAS